MSDENDSQTDDLTAETEQDSDLVKRLRSELKQRDAAINEEREQRQRLERQTAFRDAGVDPTKGPGKLLYEAYDGEADAEAVKAKAKEYGLDLSTPTQQGQEQEDEVQDFTEQERTAMEQMDQAAQGGSPDRLPTDPSQAAHEAFDREMATSGSRKEAMAKSFNARMIAALEAQKKGR